jgi:hypothetical protein
MEKGVKIVEFTRMASNIWVFELDATWMVLPYMGSLKHITMCHVFRIANTKARNFSLSFFVPMHTIIVNLLSLLFGLKISQSFIRLLEVSCHSLVANIPPKM